GDIAVATGVCDGCKHDWYSAGHPQQRPHGRGAVGQDDVRRERDQIRRTLAYRVRVRTGPPVFDAHVAANRPTRLLQPLKERRKAILAVPIVRSRGDQYANTPHPLALRARRERPSYGRAEKGENLTSSQLIELHSVPSQPRPDCRINRIGNGQSGGIWSRHVSPSPKSGGTGLKVQSARGPVSGRLRP